MSKDIITLYRYDSEYSADSVEWCPHEPNQNVFVCANYYLQKNENTENKQDIRLGRILLFSISQSDGLRLQEVLDTVGILDMKWCHNQVNGHSILGVVNSGKTIEIYKLSKEGSNLSLITSYTIDDDNEETLILSLDWSTGKYESQSPEIICSDSKGSVHLLQFNGSSLILLNSTKTHGFEAWIAAFYYWDTNVYFSGGDDCIFMKYDRRIGFEPVAKNKSHDAGVTCMHSNKNKEFLVATGSYDTYLRLWDIRYMKAALNSLETPGTMWRIKWDPHGCTSMLIACMLGGVHIVDNSTEDEMKIVGSYDEHKNLAYGADWCHLPTDKVDSFSENGKKLIGSCSFYDKLLCISVIK